jgi:flagellar FliL protein
MDDIDNDNLDSNVENATEDGGEPPPVPKSGKGKGVIIFSAIVVIVAAGGAGGFFLHSRAKHKVKSAAVAEKQTKEARPKLGPLIEMRPLVANLNDPEGGRYLKVAMFIEVNNEESKVAVESSIVPIRSKALVYLSNLTINDTFGAKGKTDIAENLRKLFEDIVGKKIIKQVYFGEFVVQ